MWCGGIIAAFVVPIRPSVRPPLRSFVRSFVSSHPIHPSIQPWEPMAQLGGGKAKRGKRRGGGRRDRYIAASHLLLRSTLPIPHPSIHTIHTIPHLPYHTKQHHTHQTSDSSRSVIQETKNIRIESKQVKTMAIIFPPTHAHAHTHNRKLAARGGLAITIFKPPSSPSPSPPPPPPPSPADRAWAGTV